MSPPKIKWPEQIVIPQRVGAGVYDNSKGPVCAIGYAKREFKQDGEVSVYLVPLKWRKRYIEIAIRLDLCSVYDAVENLNDRLKPPARTELYLMTWASFGYVCGMPAEIVKKVRKLGYKV